MLQTFNVPAGGRQIDAAGNFFRYESASANGADETIRVRVDGNDLGSYLPGDSIRLPIAGKRWEVLPVTPTATMIVRIGLGSVESARLVGQVEVIDSAKSRVLSDNEWIVSMNLAPAGGGNFTTAELWNATTDKGLAIKSVSLSSDIAQSIVVGTNPTELVPTLTTGVNSKRVTAGGVLTQPASIRANRKNNSVAQDPVPTLLCTIAMSAGVRAELGLAGVPIVVGPGAGVRFASAVANGTISCVFNGEVFRW